MKQNPSRRQASASYLDTLRSELDALTQRLQEAETAASTAQQEADAKRRAYHELEQRSNSTHWSVTEQRLFREKNQLEAVARQLQQDLVPLREEHARLKWKVQAPAQLEAARVEMAALTDRRTALAQEIHKAKTLQTQFDARIEAVEQQIASDTQSAANRLINAGELTALPAALASLHAELTATRHTRDEVVRRIQTLQAEHDALPEQIRLARDSYQGAQAIVAEIDLQEQLPAFIGVIARAAVARHRAGFTREQGRYEIEIPVEALEAASTALDADLSAR
jgi:predicted  nucleic acid-binding Zn-ribbon protein